MCAQQRQGFWQEAFALQGAVTSLVLIRVLVFGAIAAGLCGFELLLEMVFQQRFTLEITPHELAGAGLGLLIVMRDERRLRPLVGGPQALGWFRRSMQEFVHWRNVVRSR